MLVLFMLILPLPDYERFLTSTATGLSLLGMWRLIAALLALHLALEAVWSRTRRWRTLMIAAVVAMMGHQWMYGAVAEASFRWSAVYRVPTSIEELASTDLNIRAQAAGILSWYGANSAPAIPALMRALDNEAWGLRSSAAHALGAIGPEASPALPLLEAISRDDPDWHVRDSARRAIQRIRK